MTMTMWLKGSVYEDIASKLEDKLGRYPTDEEVMLEAEKLDAHYAYMFDDINAEELKGN